VFPRLKHAVVSTLRRADGVDGHRVLFFSRSVAPYAGTMTAVYAGIPAATVTRMPSGMGNYSLLGYVAQISLLNFSIAARIHCLLACTSTIRMDGPIRGQSRDRPEIQRPSRRGPSPSGARASAVISSCEFRSRPDQQVLQWFGDWEYFSGGLVRAAVTPPLSSASCFDNSTKLGPCHCRWSLWLALLPAFVLPWKPVTA